MQIFGQLLCHRGHVTLPYFAGLTEQLARTLMVKGISSSINSRGAVRETLVSPKDKLKKEQQVGIVYHTICSYTGSF